MDIDYGFNVNDKPNLDLQAKESSAQSNIVPMESESLTPCVPLQL